MEVTEAEARLLDGEASTSLPHPLGSGGLPSPQLQPPRAGALPLQLR